MPAWLVPLQEGKALALDKAVVLLGRSPDCDYILKDSRKVSRLHCCIAQVNQSFVIRDLGSTNGIQVNGQQVREAVVQIGDQVTVGDVAFSLQRTSQRAPAAVAAPVRAAAPPPAHRRRPAPEELSQEYPIAIPESDLDSLSRETPNEYPIPLPEDDGIVQLDSGEIELR